MSGTAIQPPSQPQSRKESKIYVSKRDKIPEGKGRWDSMSYVKLYLKQDKVRLGIYNYEKPLCGLFGCWVAGHQESKRKSIYQNYYQIHRLKKYQNYSQTHRLRK